MVAQKASFTICLLVHLRYQLCTSTSLVNIKIGKDNTS